MIRWTRHDEIGPMSLANTFIALDATQPQTILAVGTCGNLTTNRLVSEVVLNNWQQFYDDRRGMRWTTNATLTQMPGETLIDFQSVVLHELGHYLGLGHDGDPSTVMAVTYRGRIVALAPCDLDRMRLLYCSSSVGNPPGQSPPVGVRQQVRSLWDFRTIDDGERLLISIPEPQGPTLRVEVFTVDGRSVLRLDLDASESRGRHIVDISNIPRGQYIASASVGDLTVGHMFMR